MSEKTGEKNFIEAYIIIQEFYNDSTVFVVGSAPFGKIWFDYERVYKQYEVLTADWLEEYGDKVTTHSKKPRIVTILLNEDDVIFADDEPTEINIDIHIEPVVQEPVPAPSPVQVQVPEPAPVPAPVPVEDKNTKPKKEPKPRAKKEPAVVKEKEPAVIKEKKPRAKKEPATVPVPVPTTGEVQEVSVKKPRAKKAKDVPV